MAIIDIKAIPATFEDGIMSLTISTMIGDGLGRIRTDTSRVSDIEAEMQGLARHLKTAKPEQGFYLSASVVRGRAPNGFKKLEAIKYNPAKVGLEPAT